MCCVFQGYLVVDSFFSEEELNPCKDAVNSLVDKLAHKLYDAGKIKSTYQVVLLYNFACTCIC